METLQKAYDNLIGMIRSSDNEHTRMVLMDAAQSIAYGMHDLDNTFDLSGALHAMHVEPVRLCLVAA